MASLVMQDKVNISVAIIPMAQDFGWSPTISGLVQSSFFYGYALTQIPGGYVTSRIGGRKVLPAGVSLWSVATAAVPLLAGTIPGVFRADFAVIGFEEQTLAFYYRTNVHCPDASEMAQRHIIRVISITGIAISQVTTRQPEFGRMQLVLTGICGKDTGLQITLLVCSS